MTDENSVAIGTILVDTGPRRNTRYLGDGVYVEKDDIQIWLYTFDGIVCTNQIALDPSVYANLMRYVDGGCQP